jgi:hypothetical protein
MDKINKSDTLPPLQQQIRACQKTKKHANMAILHSPSRLEDWLLASIHGQHVDVDNGLFNVHSKVER